MQLCKNKQLTTQLQSIALIGKRAQMAISVCADMN